MRRSPSQCPWLVRRLATVLLGAFTLLATATPAFATPPQVEKQHAQPPVAFGLLLNPLETGVSTLVNQLVLITPIALLGNGRGACVLAPQIYGLTQHEVGGAGLQVGFRIFSGRRYDGLYFGVRFGGGVGNRSFKTFMGQIDAGWLWAFRKFRLGLGINAGGGYVSHDEDRGSLYLFSLDLSVGFAIGRFAQ
jgi:hypothetical protein